ncbi:MULTISPECIES: anti-sigma factor [unclassified Paracoccus (in: a-proteobacteria)]|uniref:anti-sigma factor n=1 Tax=unclassified Paracoccus (in: a-proteobacteria) TaxID=2688777 RepID=UPI0012B3B750|nr:MULTISPECIES: anti-sigma factor [unclassified Paracoccus (in: a-proteobacteria)]UXU76037.1 anti-sigma factor [Paracoccus sp. SMMA_5]UXU81947.1 anti-sigma factor [Paracoccus sp. SMMA_5_TC]
MTDPARPEPDPTDIATAGEYVLGTLPLAERLAFQQRLLVEPALVAEVTRWQAHFDPMAEEVRPVTPPASVWRGIEARLFPPAVGQGQASFWRWLAFGSSAVAAVFAALVWLGPVAPPASSPLWVSDMVSQDGSVRLAAIYDEARGEMRVSVGGSAPASGRDYELWLIQGDRAPISLGVMPHQGQAAMPIDPALRALVANATLAITDEPQGGSPAGVATGPIVAAAPLRRI